MNAKSKLKVKYVEKVIEMNTTFAKMMQNPLSDEYTLLQKTRLENPDFTISIRKIKTNPKKDTYKGLTYDWMRNYIKTHESEDTVKVKLAEIDDMIDISKCHKVSLRYPTIKKWFLDQYPEIAQFGTIEGKNDDQGGQTKNVIPMNNVDEQKGA